MNQKHSGSELKPDPDVSDHRRPDQKVGRRGALKVGAGAIVGAAAGSTTAAGVAEYDNGHPTATARVSPLVAENTRITTPIQIIWRGGSTARRAEFQGPRAALTFDDGPDPHWTSIALDILKKRDAKATFFMLGSFVEQHPGVAESVVAAGHEVGNHGWDHRHMTVLAADRISDSLLQTQQAIRNATGRVPSLMRPPYGQFDAPTAWAAAHIGNSIVLWSHRMTADDPWTRARENISSAVDGMIMLSHDGRGTPTSEQMEAAGWMITEMQNRGWTFVTVSELLQQPRSSDEDAPSSGNRSHPSD